MQLHNLVQPIEGMSDEELRARLIELRRRRETERPKAAKAAKKSEGKESRKKVTSAEKLLADLSPEQLALLLTQLGETE